MKTTIIYQSIPSIARKYAKFAQTRDRLNFFRVLGNVGWVGREQVVKGKLEPVYEYIRSLGA